MIREYFAGVIMVWKGDEMIYQRPQYGFLTYCGAYVFYCVVFVLFRRGRGLDLRGKSSRDNVFLHNRHHIISPSSYSIFGRRHHLSLRCQAFPIPFTKENHRCPNPATFPGNRNCYVPLRTLQQSDSIRFDKGLSR